MSWARWSPSWRSSTGLWGDALKAATAQPRKLRGRAIVATNKLTQLQQTMSTLVPQIAAGLAQAMSPAAKIISLHIPQLYSVVRGKVGKSVEFGLMGDHMPTGPIPAGHVGRDRLELQDTKFALRAVEDHIKIFQKAPRAYPYD